MRVPQAVTGNPRDAWMPYRSVTHGGITLLCFPPQDLAFARIAAAELAGLDQPSPEALQAILVAAYPRAIVRARESIAALGDGTAWYVYRDGRYSPFDDRDPWWEDEQVASLIIDADGRYADASPAALELLGIDLDRLRTMSTGSLTDPAVRPTVPWIWALLDDVGELHSTSILVTPDGRRIPVEYRLVRGGAPDGRSISYMRPVPLEAARAIDDPGAASRDER